MFEHIRSFFTNPPKPASSGPGGGQSAEGADPMPHFQQAWKAGALYDDLFGDQPFSLHGSIGPTGADNHRADVAKVETFLGDAGYYKPMTDNGPGGWHNPSLDQAIRDFQKDKGLQVDGVLKPNGPTIGKLGSVQGGAPPTPKAPKPPLLLAAVPVLVPQEKTNPFGSPLGADRWEAGTMADVLLGKSDYAGGPLDHFKGLFAHDRTGALNYTAAVYDSMAQRNPEQAAKFASQMQEAGMGGEGRPEPIATSEPSQGSSVPVPAQPKSSSVSPEFLDAIFTAEQGGKVGEQRKPDEVGSGSTEKGRYQINDGGLREIGWKDGSGNWTAEAARNGIKSTDDFLRSEVAQNAAAQRFFSRKEEGLRKLGAFSDVGREVKGVKEDFKISEAGLLAAAHRDGEKTVKAYLDHQMKSGWSSRFDNLSPETKAEFDLKDKSGNITRSTEDRFRAIETRLRTFEMVKR